VKGFVAALIALGITGSGSAPTLPNSALAVWRDGGWHRWWRSSAAPVRWAAPDPTLTGALAWRPVADGVAWAELRLAGSGEAWRTRAIVARLDPTRVRLRLDTAFAKDSRRAAWSLASAPAEALFAANAGQFLYTLPWGWVVLDGRQFLAPGRGPLATAFIVDSSGAIRWAPADALAHPGTRRGVAAAFQSYPTLLEDDGTIPPPLRAPGPHVNLGHRDARLAIGQTRDGILLVALTRFDAAGDALGQVPFGLTTPEMAALMGALGARDAVMLDGGISAQMQIGQGPSRVRWPGLRKVPLALIAEPR